jgi:hypothetical protein
MYCICAGFFAFFSFVGWRPLLPSNIAWLGNGDPATFYLGWQFFRNSNWSFPIGLNPQYGLELSNAILFSDSNPLFAFLFKPFSPLLPEVFQYFGLWLLICFILQAWFAYKLMSLISKNIWIVILGASFFVCAPPMLSRLQGHYSLAAHFFILAALYLALAPLGKWRILKWAALTALCALVHPYLLAMVGAIWCVDSIWRCYQKTLSLKNVLLESLWVLIVTSLACWQAGYFSVGRGLASQGFGYFRMNLLSIFDAQGFSYVLQNVPKNELAYEGFNYLGLGLILLIMSLVMHAIIAPAGKIKPLLFRAIKTWPMLFALMVCLSAFALTNRIGIATFEYSFSLPYSIANLANIFRASGRMFWPAYYLITFAIIYLVVRIFSARAAIVLMILCLLIQYVDTSKIWLDTRTKYRVSPSSVWKTAMVNPFWQDAAAHYQKIRTLLPGNEVQHWKPIAYYANVYHLPTDAAYLGRMSSQAVSRSVQAAKESMLSGQFDPHSLYFIDESVISFDSLDSNQPLIHYDPHKDLLARIDGFAILAPGWKNCASCSKVEQEITAQDLLPPTIQTNIRLLFNQNATNRRYLIKGWSIPDQEGVWSDGKSATLLLPLKNTRVSQILFETHPFITPTHPAQKVEVMINGQNIATVTLTANSGDSFAIPIPEKIQQQLLTGQPLMKVQLFFPNTARPIDFGVNNDTRDLGLHLLALTVVSK